MPVKFTETKSELCLMESIASRALRMGFKRDRTDLIMDLAATHCNGCRLDLIKFVNFTDFNFAHDVSGIIRHLNRATGKLENCFFPRCAK